jgi:hypothetical protein
MATDMTRQWKIVCGGIVAYVAVLFAYAWFAWCLASGTKGGLFGDAFGAFNAAFSGLGFFGLAFAIYLQHEQLKLQQIELRLQREELSLTREQLTRSAQAQEETEKALRTQLRVMALSSRLTASTLLIKEEVSHLREHHQMMQVESVTTWALEQKLNEVQTRLDANQAQQGDHCLRANLTDLISLRRDLKAIHDELRTI